MRFTRSVELPGHDPATVRAWHDRPGALERLIPPWVRVEILEGAGGGDLVAMKVRQGPVTVTWRLRRTEAKEGAGFTFKQESGPFARWSHAHRFAPADGGGTIVTDDIEFEPPQGATGIALTASSIKRELARLFHFRHRRLATDLARHAESSDWPRLRVGITGSSGMVGSALRHFLTSGGHEVVRLVRRQDAVGLRQAYWNPAADEIDLDALTGLDAVVHLAGVAIAKGRWTPERKRAIMESRVQGTRLIARAMAEARDGPRTLVSASAVGFYGNRGDRRLDERASAGRGFLADVCRGWEDSTSEAGRAGIRVVRMRVGIVLSPAGGALGQMLLPFKFGIGGRIATGRQYMSWIDADDLTAVIHHVLVTPGIRGAVNATAPNPVPNAAFTSALGRALGRPTIVPLPSLAVKAAFGELGREALIWGQRVVPRKLIDSGFRFDYEGVEESLRFQLGSVGRL